MLELFLIPGYSGRDSFPEPVARKIPQLCRCHDGLQYPGLMGSELPSTKTEEIAAHLIRQILRRCPSSRYGLCGYSFGGILAYEIACQMKAKGLDVEALILWDTDFDRSMILGRRSFPAAVSKFLQRLKGRDLVGKYRFLRRAFKNKRKTDKAWLSRKVRRVFALAGEPPQRAQTVEERVVQASREAHKNYSPKPFYGDAVLFKTLDRGGIFLQEIMSEDLGWSEFVHGRLEVIDIPGHHLDMWEEPTIHLLAEKTADWLKKRVAFSSNH
jgi:aspartate racemase